MTIFERIRERREALGITQKELAKLTGYTSRSMIGKIENGARDINQSQIVIFAKALQTTPSYLMGWEEIKQTPRAKGVKIPVLGKIAAGVPVEAIEDIVDYEEITQEESLTGSFFGLVINGESMATRMLPGDVVIVRQQSDADTGDVVVALIDGCDATVKRTTAPYYEQCAHNTINTT